VQKSYEYILSDFSDFVKKKDIVKFSLKKKGILRESFWDIREKRFFFKFWGL